MKVSFPGMIKSGASVMTPTIKNGLWMLGGVVLAVAITVGAQQAPPAPPIAPCDDLTKAMSAALQKNITMIGGMQPDPTKYFTPGGPNSFICGISLANLDLSGLIPDVMGLLSAAATQLLNAAMNKACNAVTRNFGGTVNQVNSAINMANGVTNGPVVQNAIDSAVGRTVDNALGQYATNYNNASPTTSPLVTAGITNPQPANGQSPLVAPPTSVPYSGAPTPITNNVTPPAAASKSASSPSILSCLLGGC